MNKNTNKTITGYTNNENTSFLENLFSHMVFYCISEIEKNNFIQYILEANTELENPFDINQEFLESEIQRLLKEKHIMEMENYYYVLKCKVILNANQKNAHNYNKLIELYIQKNVKEDTKIKKQILPYTNQKEA